MALVDSLERRSHPSNPDRWLIRGFGGEPSVAGVEVNEDNALSATAIWAGVRVISETVAMLPLKLMERVDERSKKPARHMGLFYVLHDEPNPEQTSFEFRELMQGFLLLWGNAYAQKVYNGRGEVTEIWPLAPWRVTPQRSPAGTLTFRVRPPDNHGADVILSADDVLHIRGFSSTGLMGDNAVQRFRNAIGLSLASEEFGGRFFGNGLSASGGLSSDKVLGPDGRKNLRESFTENHGGVSKAHRLMILEEGVKWFQTSVDPEKAQALETRKFQITEVARILNLPPHLLKDLERATFTNIEHQGQEFVTYSMQPWLTRWEQRLNRSLLLPSQRSRYFTQFEIRGLLRGDSAARGAYYTQMFNTGAYSPNDIREHEGEEPVEGGDQRFVQGAVVPIDKIAAMVESSIKAKNTPPPPPPPMVDDEELKDDDARRALTAFQPMVRDVLDRAARREKTSAVRASKRGLLGFRAWLVEYQDDQAEYMKRGLMPIAMGALAMLGKTGDDMRAVGDVVAGEIASHVRAYRSLQEPSEQVVTEMLARLGGDAIDATAREMTDRLIGALAGPVALRAAVGAPIVNISLPAHHTQVHQPNISLNIANEQSKARRKQSGEMVRSADGKLLVEITETEV